MRFTKVGAAMIAALCAVVVVCGVALWKVESRLYDAHPDHSGVGTPRVSAAEPGGDEPVLQRVIDGVLGGLGCVPEPSGAADAK